MKLERAGVMGGCVIVIIFIFQHTVHRERAEDLTQQPAHSSQTTKGWGRCCAHFTEEETDTRGSSDLPKVTQPVRSGSRLQTRSDSRVRASSHPTK